MTTPLHTHSKHIAAGHPYIPTYCMFNFNAYKLQTISFYAVRNRHYAKHIFDEPHYSITVASQQRSVFHCNLLSWYLVHYTVILNTVSLSN